MCEYAVPTSRIYCIKKKVNGGQLTASKQRMTRLGRKSISTTSDGDLDTAHRSGDHGSQQHHDQGEKEGVLELHLDVKSNVFG